jgi:branched-chain amino acid transport system substrate-binding protein
MRAQSRAGRSCAVSALVVLLMLVPMLDGCAGGPSADSTTSIVSNTSTTVAVSTTSATDPSAATTSLAPVPEAVHIGALFPLTGDLATQGGECLDGMRLAIDEVNAAGGIRSLGGVRLELSQGDSQGDPENADKEFTRLATEEEAIAVVGAYQSAVALPAGETAEELQTPFVVSTGAANEITERDFRYTFRLCPKAVWYARDQVRFLSESALSGTEPITKVALLHEDGEFGSETAADQRKYLQEAGIEVVQEIEYPADQADFSQEVLQIKSGEGQAVLTATYLNDAVLIADSAKKLRLGIPVFDAGGGTTDADFLDRAGNTSESLITELEYCAGSSATQLEKRYAAAHGGKLPAAALYSYQAVWLIANALERAASTEHERLRAALATTAMVPEDHMVLPQRVLSFDEDGQNRGSRLFVAQIQDLKYVPVWPTEYAQDAVSLP